MIESFRAVYKKIIKPIVRKVQIVLAMVLLTLLYLFGIGMTWFLAWMFNRKMVRRDLSVRESYWEEAAGYEPDMEKSFKQS